MEPEHTDTTKLIESSAGCFKDLGEDDLALLNNRKTQIEYLKGDTIFKQGAFATHVLYVSKGIVRVYLQTSRDKHINIWLARSGDFLAFPAVFGDDKYHYSATALVDSVVCMIDKDALRALLLRNAPFAMRIATRNNRSESRLLEIIKNVTYKQMRGKLASALLYLAHKDGDEDSVFKYLSRKDIADFASITLESAVKFLKEFENEAIIKLDGKDIIISDRLHLEEISRVG